ncbi:MAG: hypothetical protein R2849_13550 [Thermomicrobiales bacterium]
MEDSIHGFRSSANNGTGTTAAPGEGLAQASGTGRPYRHDRRTRRWRRFKRNRLSVVGAGVIVFLAIMAVVGPFVAPYPEDATGAVDIRNRLQAPSSDHWFGTDEVGRDILTRILVGSRLSLGAGFVVLVVATTIGTILGVTSGFFGGKVDTIIQRITDVFLTVPGLILAMASQRPLALASSTSFLRSSSVVARL